MLDARAKTVKEILHSGDQYLIPFFQRSYAWEPKHWQRILADVDALSETAPERAHFLGPLVCAPTAHVPGEVTPYQLIDGQQRLTTLTLMLCAIRELAQQHGLIDLAAEISEDYLLHKRRKGLSRYKVVPRLGDREAIVAILEGKDVSPWNDFRVAKCVRFFTKEFGKRSSTQPQEELPKLLRDFTARMGLVVITVVGENPYEIFESLNSTGLPLEQSDLIRNFVFMDVPLDDQQMFYDEHWRPFEMSFDPPEKNEAISPTDFYRDYLLKAGTYLAAKDTYADFRDESNRRGLAPDALVKDLNRYLTLERSITHPSTCSDSRVKKCLVETSQLDVTTANPLLLVLLARLEDGSLSHEQFQETVRDLASFVIRRSIRGESTRAYGRWFTEAIKRLGDNPVEHLRDYWTERGWPNDREFIESLIPFPIYRREPAKCRLMLERLEESYAHKEKVDPSTLTIEHVLPQTLDEGPSGMQWRGALGPNWFEAQQRWVHTIGNLTLTGYNSEMSNSAYDIKRGALVTSNLLLNSHFRQIDGWDVRTIEQRGRLLAKEIVDLWPNPRQVSVPNNVAAAAEPVPVKTNFDIEQLRSQSLRRVASFLKTELMQEGEARYASADERCHVLCLASQPYDDGSGYWFGVAPMQLAFLREVEDAHVALCCGSPDRILWIPRKDFLVFVENMNETDGKHWHIQIAWTDAARLDQPKLRSKADVGRYLLPM
jgi:uncharacterized protein with ParB-like and HNH nuclease domain